jgi:transketolase
MFDDKIKRNMKEVAKSVRALSIDAVQAANSGHPGLPLGCADLGTLLYTNILKHNPKNPNWINRDRFVLSAGHGSMLLYSLLHLTGYNLSLDEIKKFRQLGSKTPGHPEYGHTVGVETTTGPLGAGFSNAVGMAIAESHLAEKFNTDDYKIIDNYTYALAGDGCLMEGISSEAASMAGHLGLGKLIVFYDSNRITIEGSTDIAFTENVETRFKAYGWQILEGSAYNYDEIQTLVNIAKADKTRPTLITLNSIIGYGSPNKQGTHDVHGAPLGKDEIIETRKVLGIPEDEEFYISPSVKPFIKDKQHDWDITMKNWEINLAKWADENPELKKEWNAFFGETDLDQIEFPSYEIGDKEATRNSSGKCINAIANTLSNFIGGSADLAPSNKTNMKDKGDYDKLNRLGRNIHFGVREHAMGGVANGMLLYGGLRTFAATFLVFCDYMRPAIRLAALMKIPQIYVFTHDSIFVGEDGPTHQPIEHAESLRIIPNLNVLRPGDGEETIEAWKMALESKETPTALLLTRQNLNVYTKEDSDWKTNIRKGAYIVQKFDDPELVVLASGSEVSLVDEAIKLADRKVQLVSVLSRKLFENNINDLKELIPEGVKVVAIEAGVTSGWKAFADEVIGIDRFGECGPGAQVADYFGLTAQKIADKLNEL